ncbi:MAG: glycosyltransferase family 4 protein [bacterium]|nr:glycosyltransferase family 4 protein [bacterium]
MSPEHSFSLVVPEVLTKDDSSIVDTQDVVPPNVAITAYGSSGFAKYQLQSGSLELRAGLEVAAEKLGGPDVALVLNCFPVAPTVADFAAAEGIPAVYSLRGADGYRWLDGEQYPSSIDPAIAQRIAARYRRSIDSGTHVTAASEWLAAQARRYGVQVESIVPSPAPVDPAAECDRTEARRVLAELDEIGDESNALSSDRNRMLICGRLSPDKRPLEAIAGLVESRHLQEWQLLVLGNGPLTREVNAAAAQANTEYGWKKVVVGSLPPRLVGWGYASSDVLMHNARGDENFMDARPSAVTAAAHYGLPVVHERNAGGCAESLSKENYEALAFSGTSNRSTAPTLDQALERLADPAQRDQIGSANRVVANSTAPGVWATTVIEQLEVATR